MKENSLEVIRYIQIARKYFKEGNIYKANEIYKKLINQKIYTYDLLVSYGVFNKDINNDGFDDIVIGSRFIDGSNLRGKVEVIYGQDLSIIETLSIVERQSKTWTFDEKEVSIGRKLGMISVGEQKFLVTTTVVSE